MANGAGTYWHRKACSASIRPTGADAGSHPADLQRQCRPDGRRRRRHRREDPADLRKRVAWVKSARAEPQCHLPRLRRLVGTMEKVEFAGFGALGRHGRQPGGCRLRDHGFGKPSRWPPTPGACLAGTPHGDTAAGTACSPWPPTSPRTVKVGAAVPEGGIEGMAYPYPILTVRADMGEDMALDHPIADRDL